MNQADQKIAVIATGGKQYVVAEGQTIQIEKLEQEAGKKVVFGEVLLTAAGDKTVFGAPFIDKATVEGEIVTHGRDKKLFGVKFKAKKRYMRVFGHKQHHTEVKITKI